MIGLLFLAKHMMLNYLGFCTKTGEKVGAERLIDYFIRTILSEETIFEVYESVPKVGGPLNPNPNFGNRYLATINIDADSVIRYKDEEEFRKINVDCCRFALTGYYGQVYLGPSLIERTLFGHGKGYVHITYRVRYKGIDGVVRTGWQAHSARFNNCGDQTDLIRKNSLPPF
jgi:hypothetical protein